MRRHLLGLIALALLLPGAIGLFWGFSTQSHAGMAAGVGVRAGLILGAWWMAFPQLQQLTKNVPFWLTGPVLIGALVVVIRPSSIALVAPAVLILVALQGVGWLFKPLPRQKKKAVSRREGSAKK